MGDVLYSQGIFHAGKFFPAIESYGDIVRCIVFDQFDEGVGETECGASWEPGFGLHAHWHEGIVGAVNESHTIEQKQSRTRVWHVVRHFRLLCQFRTQCAVIRDGQRCVWEIGLGERLHHRNSKFFCVMDGIARV